MASTSKIIFLLFFFLVASHDSTIVALGKEDTQKIRLPPKIDRAIDGAGIVRDLSDTNFGAKVHTRRVSVLSVAIFTLAMALATGFGALPFFFVELDAHWAGVCNGLAAGVMLAASFGLIQEGQAYGNGIWVVFGILLGGIFICLCKKFLEQYGEMSMLDIKGADASRVVLVIGIMTLHSFGEGSGVGVSFAGTKGLSQGLIVTLAIAVHNIPEGLAVSLVLSSRGVSPQKALLWSIITSLPQPIVAVPSFLCAETFNKFLPFCTGFAAGCMIWMVIAEVIPDAFKQAPPAQVASAGTIAVAFMETLGMALQNFSREDGLENAYGFLVSLLFGLGPLIGGLIFVSFAVIFRLRHTFLMGMASGIAFLLSIWRPLQLIMFSKMAFVTLVTLLATGAATSHVFLANILKLTREKKASLNKLSSPSAPSLNVFALQSFLACGAISLHALAEGLALGVAAPKAYGLGRHMILPVSLHGLPRGAAVASCTYGVFGSSRGALAAATLTGFAGPLSAIGSIMAGIDYSGLDYWMVFACGALLPSFWSVFRRSVLVDRPGSILGLLMGFGSAYVCMMSTRLVCLYTPYCNSAPEAVT